MEDHQILTCSTFLKKMEIGECLNILNIQTYLNILRNNYQQVHIRYILGVRIQERDNLIARVNKTQLCPV